MNDSPIAVVCGFSVGFRAVASVSVPTMQAYAQKHGYRFLCYDFKEEHNAWPKPQVLTHTLQDAGIEYLFWIDADAIITNDQISLGDLAAKYLHGQDAALAMTCDIAGPNTGVMLMKNHPIVRALLWTCVQIGLPRHATDPWHEQAAVREFVLYPPYRDATVYVDQRVMNSYRNDLYGDQRPLEVGMWQKGDFVLHLPNIDNNRRVSVMRETLAALGK